MHLEEYFEFLAPDDIRIKGTRIGIETVLYDHIHRRRTPEQIIASYPSLTLELVYATILYYLHKREMIEGYLSDWLEFGHRARWEQARDPAVQDFKERLRQRARRGRDGRRVPWSPSTNEPTLPLRRER